MPAIKESLSFYLAIGLVQAALLLAVRHLEQSGVIAAVVAAVLVGGINLQLLGANARLRGTWMWVVGLALLFAAVSAWVFISTGSDTRSDSWLRMSWVLSSVTSGYIATAFILSWPAREHNRVRYEDLFQHAWNNAFIVLLALLLCGLFWMLLGLCGGLFNMLGIDAFKRLFSTAEFIVISLAVVFSLGMRMGRENEKVIGMLRGILLTLCRFLMPLAALIVVLFTVTLPFTGLESIWKTGYATPILLCLVAITIFLVNGVFQDGRHPTGYPMWLVQFVNVSLLCLPVLTALAGYSSWLRIEQYGLSPARFAAMLLTLLAGIYSLVTVYAVFRSQSVWLGNLRTSNPVLALVTFIIVVAIHGPWLNPLDSSARNQVQRLLDGRTPVADFDASNLRNHLGLTGRRQFDALLAKVEKEHLFDTESRERLLSTMRAMTDDENANANVSRALRTKKLVWIGPEVEGSEQFAAPDLGEMTCEDSGCALWAVDLDGDGQKEVLQISINKSWYPIYFFTRTSKGKWVQGGLVEGGRNTDQVIDLIRQGKAAVIKPRYDNLDIGGTLFTPKLSAKADDPIARE